MEPERIAEPNELAAAVAARREMGEDYDQALVENFLERVDQRLQERVTTLTQGREGAEAARSRQFVLGIISLGCGIPITAISAGISDLPGLIVAWTGIVGINLAHSLKRG